MTIPDNIKQAYQLALTAREKAYAPYSQFLVGAAVKLKNDEKIYTGFNIENSSYGATICGERVALFSALSQSKSQEIEYMVLVTLPDPPSFPCGICRQTISEFCPDPETPLYIGNLKSVSIKTTLGELLPHRFQKADLD